MNDSVATALIISLPPTVAAAAALVVGIRTSAKADVIHTLANDNLSKATNALAVANETVRGLQATVALLVDNKKVSDLQAAGLAAKIGSDKPAA